MEKGKKTTPRQRRPPLLRGNFMTPPIPSDGSGQALGGNDNLGFTIL
jgi:hypothetical protein